MTARFLPFVLSGIMMLAIGWQSLLVTANGTIMAPALAGDVLIVTTTHGQRIVIDTGNDAPQLLEFLGMHTALWAPRSADTLVLTHTGSAWQGALTAVLAHGIARVIVLPDADATLCTSIAIPCHVVPVGTQWHQDDVTFRVVAPNMLWVIWAHAGLLVAHSATTAQLETSATTLHCPRPHCFVSYGWEITPPWHLHDALQPLGVLYSNGQTQKPAARLSMAQRRPYHERLWHEQLVGTITISLSNPTRIRVSEASP